MQIGMMELWQWSMLMEDAAAHVATCGFSSPPPSPHACCSGSRPAAVIGHFARAPYRQAADEQPDTGVPPCPPTHRTLLEGSLGGFGLQEVATVLLLLLGGSGLSAALAAVVLCR